MQKKALGTNISLGSFSLRKHRNKNLNTVSFKRQRKYYLVSDIQTSIVGLLSIWNNHSGRRRTGAKI